MNSLKSKVGAGLAAIMSTVASQGADIIGPGTAIPSEALDTAGGRINLDTGTPVTLAAGTYSATLFSYDAGVAGDVTPFLATLTGGNQYLAIAVGATQNVAVPIQDATVAFGGAFSFTLGATTQVFAGIASSTQNPIFLDNGTGPFTEHEGGGQPAASYIITNGGPVAPDGSFSNPDLGRRYAFSVTVIPESSAAGLAMLGGVMLLGMRRRPA